ncbi:MAG: hypothetical protein ACK4MV_14860 [Beijerinckiaceae bacterium]
MRPRRPSLPLERAASNLLRARAALDEAAHELQSLSETSGDRMAISAHVAAEQARLIEALAAAIHAPPHSALDDLVAALAHGETTAPKTKRH